MWQPLRSVQKLNGSLYLSLAVFWVSSYNMVMKFPMVDL